MPAAQGIGPALQVVHRPQVTEQEVSVKAHQRVEVDCQGGKPGGGGQHEGRRAPCAVRQQRPGQQGNAGQQQLGKDSAGADQQPGAAILHAPGIADVGIQHR
ncbi:hypothetical protein D3C79_733230 [compost metagenome]